MTGTELVRDFVNTRELLEGTGGARPRPRSSPPGSRARARRRGCRAPADLRRAVELREALRQMLLANTGVEIDTSGGFEVLDQVARQARDRALLRGVRGRARPGPAGSRPRSAGS